MTKGENCWGVGRVCWDLLDTELKEGKGRDPPPSTHLLLTHLRAHGAAARGRSRVHVPALHGLALRRLAVRADAPQAEAVGAVGQDAEAAGDGLGG